MRPDPTSDAVRGYTVLCMTALMAIVLVLLEGERDLLGLLLLATVGGAAVIARWRFGPPLFLLGLGLVEWFHFMNRPWYSRAAAWQETPFLAGVLAAAALTYTAGCYRRLSLTQTIFPIDNRRPPPARPRDRGPRPAAPVVRRRSADLPGPWEAPLLAAVSGGWAAAVCVFWLALSAARPPLAMTPGTWHGVLLVFLVGLTAAVLAGAAAYLDWATAPAEQHHLYLQDQLWRETRREQNRINRWLTWARLRAQRRKEQP